METKKHHIWLLRSHWTFQKLVTDIIILKIADSLNKWKVPAVIGASRCCWIVYAKKNTHFQLVYNSTWVSQCCTHKILLLLYLLPFPSTENNKLDWGKGHACLRMEPPHAVSWIPVCYCSLLSCWGCHLAAWHLTESEKKTKQITYYWLPVLALTVDLPD